MLTVEVVLAWPDRVERVFLNLPEGATLGEALVASRLPVDPKQGAGVFGVRGTPDTLLSDGDRIEIYRPLSFDPMESRRRRARR